MNITKNSGTSMESCEDPIAKKRGFMSLFLDVLSVIVSYCKVLWDQDCQASFQQTSLPF